MGGIPAAPGGSANGCDPKGLFRRSEGKGAGRAYRIPPPAELRFVSVPGSARQRKHHASSRS